ncbi:MAG TPA: putative metallopeptidase [Candidatus Thermoplasmatota archaeon]|nr:putative metallopeptidase [Candidatus Thermoplasmatota archaeon]
MTRRKPRAKYALEVAPDVQARIHDLVAKLALDHVDPNRIVCFRSRGSTARIYARIWSLPQIWQIALGVEAHYAIEVVEAFDRQSMDDQTRTLIHELMHIPKTFSGALVPHTCFGKRIDCASVEVLFRAYAASTPGAPPAPPTG